MLQYSTFYSTEYCTPAHCSFMANQLAYCVYQCSSFFWYRREAWMLPAVQAMIFYMLLVTLFSKHAVVQNVTVFRRISGAICTMLQIIAVSATWNNIIAWIHLASFPGRFVGGGKTAWYRLFAHARNTPRFVGYRICT